MTFADGVLRLVRIGARIDSVEGDALESPDNSSATAEAIATAPEFVAGAGAVPWTAEGEFATHAADYAAGAEDVDPAEPPPGLEDLEASVALVSSGLATRVVLSGFPSWPGLLWRAYQLAETADVLILPTVVRPGGKVDIVITRATPANG
jgi:hypothetical protein